MKLAALLRPKAAKPEKEAVAKEATAKKPKIETVVSPEKKKADEFFNKGKELYHLKDYAGATEAFEQAEKLAGENAYCRVTIARAFKPVKPAEEMEQYLRRSIELAPKTAKYLNELAIFLGAKKNNEPANREAIELYEKAIKFEKDEEKILKAHLAIGQVLLLMPAAEEAEVQFRKIQKLYPGKPHHLHGMVSALSAQLKFKEAEPYCIEAVKTFPENEKIMLLMADIIISQQKYGEAAEMLEDFIKKYPQHAFRMHPLIVPSSQRAGKYTPADQHTQFFSRNYYLNNKPEYSAVQKRCIESLFDMGIATTHVEELFDEKELKLVEAADQQIMEFRNSPKVDALCKQIRESDRFEDDPSFPHGVKPYIVYYHLFEGHMKIADPIGRLMSEKKMLDISNAYNDSLTRLCNMNLWINPPLKGHNLAIRRSSQKWHRDQDDMKIVKCFIYMTDLDEESGALEFIPQSNVTSKGKYHNLFPYPHSQGYPAEKYIDAAVPDKDRVMVTGKRGKMAFVDTNGFHRGGLVSSHERRVLMSTYLVPTAQHFPRSWRPQIQNVDVNGLPPEVMYAIS